MADKDGNVLNKDYALDVPFANCKPFHIKGMQNIDWGMKDRLSRIFRPTTGKTIMLAFDHGYIVGATAGLERLDLGILPLAPYADVLMGTRGAIRAAIPPNFNKAVALRCSAGSSVLDADMSLEYIGVNIEDAIRMNASCMAVQVFVGAPHEAQSLKNLVEVIDAGNRYGIPTLGVTAVGKEMARDQRYLGLATRIVAELGAQFVKTYYCDEGFDLVVAGCPVPIVIAGGKKIPEKEALQLAFNAIRCGAAGVDMGRNIFQADDPVAMIKSVGAIVHDGENDAKAFQMYQDLKNK
jgi:3-hydroxy-5-phosphonooxypentane-2,4-dione thiolase